ncbi:MFS transporter [Micromonospora krabiensis]|uniref:Sugar phosphate permease n=1 Tax=Micromonospora krabiensis TaxID=307121 RepID=A0A1C3MZR3_9ACTN|nr:MFS transporter [Micromonospora krabiensis]SBV25784.1 Sugar phosphate permease [Micromonospora krabiensis]
MFKALRAARISTFGYFTINGFVLGAWVVHIPTIEHRAGITHATLGWLLLLLGAGAFAGMQLAGPLTDRLGARRVVPLSALLLSAAVVLPGLSTSGWSLGAALFVFGIGNGCLDVSMNAHAVQVEAGYQRPIMSAFHAWFSVGGVAAAVVGARTLSWGWSPTTTLAVVAAVSVAAVAVFRAGLLAAPTRANPTGANATGAEPTSPSWRSTPSRIWLLAALALMLMLSEGVAADWSVLALRETLDAAPATAAFAYGAFATAMTVGRLLIDRVAGRVGPVAVLRWGSVLAVLALALVVWSPSVPVVLGGWALFGAGLAGAVPQLFSAAGHSDPAAAGTNVSRVASLGYLGMLAGPAAIGGLTHVMPINLTFLLPLVFCVIAAFAAPLAGSARRSRTAPPRAVDELASAG